MNTPFSLLFLQSAILSPVKYSVFILSTIHLLTEGVICLQQKQEFTE